jgi:hypothetical protein
MNAGRLVLATLLAAVVLAAAGVLAAYRAWHTTEQIEQAVASPDSTHMARVVSVREAGANGRRYTVVRIGRDSAGALDGNDSGTVWIENARAVAVQWTAPTQLAVQYTGPAYVEGKVPRVGDVRVTYLAVDTIRTLPMALSAKKSAPKPVSPGPAAHDTTHKPVVRRVHHAG